MYVLLGTKLLWFKMYISFANILWVPICPHTWLLDIQYVSVIIPAVPLFLLCAIFLRVSFNTLIAPSNCVVYSALSSTKITCIVEWVFIGNCSCLTAHSWTNPKLRTGFPLTVDSWLGFAADTPIFATDAGILAADAHPRCRCAHPRCRRMYLRHRRTCPRCRRAWPAADVRVSAVDVDVCLRCWHA